MMFCKDCGRMFIDSETVQERVDDGEDVGYVETCPYCGSEDIISAGEDRF